MTNKSSLRIPLFSAAAFVLLVGGLLLNVHIGAVRIPAGQVFSLLLNGIRLRLLSFLHPDRYGPLFADFLTGSTEARILFGIRLPRMLLAAVLGGGLSLSGFLLQAFFRNPIAGPFVLGISSGAKMLVSLTMIFLLPSLSSMNSGVMVLAAFAGSLLVTGIVLLFAQKVQNMSMLLVIGIMVSYLCSAVTDFCVTFADEHHIAGLTGWSMGSFSSADWHAVRFCFVLTLLCLLASLLLSKPIGAYALGEGYAKSLGIHVRAFRTALILLSSLLSACVTAFAGPISFVGIAVPQITKRLLRTARPAVLIPLSFLAGAVFCIYCDLLARTAFAPTELAISTVTSIFGAPIVIRLMVERSGRR
ncbi:MAG: iron ABC transporter permease [Lachnospiraceae bacterium]|nr:iron ABC transporter permease [Lachnospiraceae bacterium]